MFVGIAEELNLSRASGRLGLVEGSTPVQVIERGESDRIWRMIWELRGGNSGD